MNRVSEMGSVTVAAMSPNGYVAKDALGGNPYLEKLKSWIWEQDKSLGPLHMSDEDHWKYEIKLVSNNVGGLTYTGIISMCISDPGITFCLKTEEFREGIYEGGAIADLIEKANAAAGDSSLFLGEDLGCRIKLQLKNPEQLTPDGIRGLIDECYERLESVVNSHEYKTWCIWGKATKPGQPIEEFSNLPELPFNF